MQPAVTAPDPGSNRGPSAYRANALLTELPDCQHIIHLVPVHTQVTPATIELDSVEGANPRWVRICESPKRLNRENA